MNYPVLIRLLAGLLIILSSTTSYAGNTDQQNAAKIAKQGQPGRVLKIKKVDLKNRSAYKVKVLRPNGDVRSVLVDPKSGKVIRKRKSAHNTNRNK